MIAVRGLTKRYGNVTAVQDISFEVHAGTVVGFLARSGKRTTLKMLAGLSAPTSGTATIAGVPYRSLPRPMHVAGFGLNAEAFHPSRAVSIGRRLVTVAALIFSLTCLIETGLAAGASARPLTPGPGRLSFKFQAAHTRAAQAGKRLWSDRFVRRTVTQLNARLTLPRDLEILVGPGQSGDSVAAGPHPSIAVSYDLAAQLRPALNHFGVYTFQGRVVKPKGQAGRRLVNHMLQQIQHAILLHELGHGYTLTWPIPTTSNDEAIADLFAGWAAVKVLNDPGALLALADYRELIASIIKTFPALAAWNRQQGYEDLFRLYHSNPGKYRAITRLIPNGAAGPGGASFGDFSPGPWSGIENALQPIALVPLG